MDRENERIGGREMILVDERVGSVEIAPFLRDAVVCRLSSADFAWSGSGPDGPANVGVERKGLKDFLQSMISGRLSGHQIIGLTADYDWPYIVLEGMWRPDRNTGILQGIGRGGKWDAVSLGSRRFMAKDIYNFINTLQIICGIPVIRTSNMQETSKWLQICHGWWQKPWDKHKSHLQFQKPAVHAQLSKPNLVTKMASQLTGIGWDKARKIGVRFETVMDLVEATERELEEVEGIGPKLAEQMVKEMEGGGD